MGNLIVNVISSLLVWVEMPSRGYMVSSLEFLPRNVVHWEVIHVSLNELESLVLDHFDSLRVEHVTQLLDLLTAQALAFFVRFIKRLPNDVLDIGKSLNALSHA